MAEFVSVHVVFMDLQSQNNLFSKEVKEYLLSISRSTPERKKEIWENIIQKLETKYPQVSHKAHHPAFLSFIMQRYVVGAFLALLVLGSLFAVDALPVPPGDSIPYFTKAQLQDAKSSVLDFFSDEVATYYQNKLVARRLEDLSSVVKSGGDSGSILVVTNNLADQLGRYYGNNKSLTANETHVALNTAKSVDKTLKEARKVLSENGISENKVVDSLDQVGQLNDDVLKGQFEAKLAEARKADENKDVVVAAEEAYQRGDLLVALEKLESASAGDVRVVKGEQIESVTVSSSTVVTSENGLQVPNETTFTAVAVVQKQKPVEKANPQIEYAVSIGD